MIKYKTGLMKSLMTFVDLVKVILIIKKHSFGVLFNV